MTKVRRFAVFLILSAAILIAGIQFPSSAQRRNPAGPAIGADTGDPGPSEMRPIIEYYVVDRSSLQRSYPVAGSPARRERFQKFYADALERIKKLDFDSMSQEGKVDYILFRNNLEHELRQLDIEARQVAEIQPLLPFAITIVDLEEARRRMEPIDSAKAATTLTNLKKQVDDTRKSIDARLKTGASDETQI